MSADHPRRLVAASRDCLIPWRGLKVSELAVPAGSVITVRTGGGGGWGPPAERDPEAVARDVRQGAVTVDGARHHYGVTITTP